MSCNFRLFATAHCLSCSQLTLIRRLERRSDEGEELLNCKHPQRSTRLNFYFIFLISECRIFKTQIYNMTPGYSTLIFATGIYFYFLGKLAFKKEQKRFRRLIWSDSSLNLKHWALSSTLKLTAFHSLVLIDTHQFNLKEFNLNSLEKFKCRQSYLSNLLFL